MDGERKISVYPDAGGGDIGPETGERVNRYKGLILGYLIALSGWKCYNVRTLTVCKFKYKLVIWCSARQPPEKPQVTFVKSDSREGRASKKQVAFANA